MSLKSPTREDQYKVHSFDLDANMKLKPARIMEWFGELAWVHANSLGFGYEELKDRNQLWVLGSVSLHFNNHPTWRKNVCVYTHIGDRNGFYYHRDLAIKDIESNTALIECRTRWIVLNAESRRPVREVEIPDDTPVGLAPLFEDAFPKFRIPTKETPTFETELTSLKDDLDQNQHVNNGRYLSWAMESYPAPFLKAHELTSIDAHFKNESFAGSLIDSQAFLIEESDQEILFHHLIQRKEDKADLCHLRFRWKPI